MPLAMRKVRVKKVYLEIKMHHVLNDKNPIWFAVFAVQSTRYKTDLSRLQQKNQIFASVVFVNLN